MPFDSDLEALRSEIDVIDRQILELLAARIRVVMRVGELKRARGAAIYDPERERLLLERVSHNPPPPLTRDVVRRVFERMIDESRRMEQAHPDE